MICVVPSRFDLTNAWHDARRDSLVRYELFKVRSEFRKIFRPRRDRIALHRTVDHPLRQARIQISAGAARN
jgi:hypothetical protein